MCDNSLCPYLKRTGTKNECHWKGQVQKVPTIGHTAQGSLKCFYCNCSPFCIALCGCKMYLCLPHDSTVQPMTRCVIHLGYHMHRVADGSSKNELDDIKQKVKNMVQQGTSCRPKSLQKQLAEDMVLEAIVSGENGLQMTNNELHALFQRLLPLLSSKR